MDFNKYFLAESLHPLNAFSVIFYLSGIATDPHIPVA